MSLFKRAFQGREKPTNLSSPTNDQYQSTISTNTQSNNHPNNTLSPKSLKIKRKWYQLTLPASAATNNRLIEQLSTQSKDDLVTSPTNKQSILSPTLFTTPPKSKQPSNPSITQSSLKLSIQSMLDRPPFVSQFRSFLLSKYAAENIDFLVAVHNQTIKWNNQPNNAAINEAIELVSAQMNSSKDQHASQSIKPLDLYAQSVKQSGYVSLGFDDPIDPSNVEVVNSPTQQPTVQCLPRSCLDIYETYILLTGDQSINLPSSIRLKIENHVEKVKHYVETIIQSTNQPVDTQVPIAQSVDSLVSRYLPPSIYESAVAEIIALLEREWLSKFYQTNEYNRLIDRLIDQSEKVSIEKQQAAQVKGKLQDEVKLINRSINHSFRKAHSISNNQSSNQSNNQSIQPLIIRPLSMKGLLESAVAERLTEQHRQRGSSALQERTSQSTRLSVDRIDQSLNQPTNLSSNLSINTDISTLPAFHPSPQIGPLVEFSLEQSINQSIEQSIRQSISQSHNLLTDCLEPPSPVSTLRPSVVRMHARSIVQSTNQPINYRFSASPQTPTSRSVNHSVYPPTIHSQPESAINTPLLSPLSFDRSINQGNQQCFSSPESADIIKKLVDHSNHQSIDQSIDQSSTQSVDQADDIIIHSSEALEIDSIEVL